MPAQINAQVILAGAIAVGGFALGKAVIDHVLWSRAPERDWDEDVFEEQHYRAAGFQRASETANVGRDIGAFAAAIIAFGMMIAAVPETAAELRRLGN